MYVLRNNEALSFNHCCSGKAISITYSQCVFVELGIQHAMRMYNIVICGLPRLQYFLTLSHKGHELSVPSRPWHQPAAIPVDNIRCCKYSQVLLMMGENIARNM